MAGDSPGREQEKAMPQRNRFFPAAFLSAAALLGAGAAPAAGDVSLDFYDRNGYYKILGSFHVRARPDTAWQVLTDYEHIPGFVGSLKKSRIQENLGPYHFSLEQVFEGGILFITHRVHVVLDVRETWHQTIAFKDTCKRDFEVYEGYWHLRSGPGPGLEVIYSLMAKQKSKPPFAGDFMKGGVKDLLEAVRREILRRQEKADREGSGGSLQGGAGGLAAEKTTKSPSPKPALGGSGADIACGSLKRVWRESFQVKPARFNKSIMSLGEKRKALR
jgi:hypothetical protein